MNTYGNILDVNCSVVSPRLKPFSFYSPPKRQSKGEAIYFGAKKPRQYHLSGFKVPKDQATTSKGEAIYFGAKKPRQYHLSALEVPKDQATTSTIALNDKDKQQVLNNTDQATASTKALNDEDKQSFVRVERKVFKKARRTLLPSCGEFVF